MNERELVLDFLWKEVRRHVRESVQHDGTPKGRAAIGRAALISQLAHRIVEGEHIAESLKTGGYGWCPHGVEMAVSSCPECVGE